MNIVNEGMNGQTARYNLLVNVLKCTLSYELHLFSRALRGLLLTVPASFPSQPSPVVLLLLLSLSLSPLFSPTPPAFTALFPFSLPPLRLPSPPLPPCSLLFPPHPGAQSYLWLQPSLLNILGDDFDFFSPKRQKSFGTKHVSWLVGQVGH